MDYLSFRNHLYAQGCFNINQVLLWEKDFDRNNLTRWCRRGLLVKLRNEHYAFPEYRQMPGFSRIVANRIYSPSYVSLQSALSFYGMIPEEVIQLTSVTTLDDLRDAVTECLKKVDLNKKKQDFAHLLFNEANADRILQFGTILSEL